MLLTLNVELTNLELLTFVSTCLTFLVASKEEVCSFDELFVIQRMEMSLHLNQQQAMVERVVESTESIHFFEEKEREDQAMVFPRLLKQMEGKLM